MRHRSRWRRHPHSPPYRHRPDLDRLQSRHLDHDRVLRHHSRRMHAILPSLLPLPAGQGAINHQQRHQGLLHHPTENSGKHEVKHNRKEAMDGTFAFDERKNRKLSRIQGLQRHDSRGSRQPSIPISKEVDVPDPEHHLQQHLCQPNKPDVAGLRVVANQQQQ